LPYRFGQADRAAVSERYLHQLIARKLVIYRQEHNASQGTIAALLGVHGAYVRGLERGELNLTLTGVERLADQLDVRVVDLICPCPRTPNLPRRGASS
jgi:transcriptional regulator with XRE-family HTH domain